MSDVEGKGAGAAARAAQSSEASWQLADVSAALAAGVAHEVNNPLTYVLANLSVVTGELGASSDPVAMRHQALLAEAAEGLLRIRDLVRDLAVFSRVDPSPSVSLRDVLEATIHLVRAEIEAHGVLDVRLSAAPPVRCRAGRLSHLLMCLLIHGNQRLIAGSSGGVNAGRMLVEARRVGAGRAEVSMQLFGYAPAGDPAAWLDAERAASPCMEYVAGAVEDMGATMACERAPADGPQPGCVFRVGLPAALSLVDASTRRRTLDVGRRLRVLVVDDEPMIRHLFTPESFDHEFVRASSGREALAALEAESFDAVFCDLIMPDVGGIEVYQHVRRHRPHLLSQFVVMSAGHYTTAARRFLDAVELPVLPKPFAADDVREFLRRFRPAVEAS